MQILGGKQTKRCCIVAQSNPINKEKIIPFMLDKSIHTSWTKDVSSVKKPMLINNNSSNTMCIFKSMFIDIMPINGTSWTCIGSIPFCKLPCIVNLKDDFLFTLVMDSIKISASKFSFALKEFTQPLENMKKIWKAGTNKLALLNINDEYYYLHIRFPCLDLYDTVSQKGFVIALKPNQLCNLLRLGKGEWYKAVADIPFDGQDCMSGSIETIFCWDKIYIGIYERKAWRVGSYRYKNEQKL
jgi:hypothetical protein